MEKQAETTQPSKTTTEDPQASQVAPGMNWPMDMVRVIATPQPDEVRLEEPGCGLVEKGYGHGV